jgi:5-methylcytosine-specific restriction endonuclease McrA
MFFADDNEPMQLSRRYYERRDWQERARARRKFDGGRCVHCKRWVGFSGPGGVVHHLNYEHLYAERIEDLVTLCWEHHRQWHEDRRRAA